ncbi:39S ribosomal protein L3, mitochondrial [Daktulosphaira vitifoliae]|uniref:39S ribosomal protein L3, mitochondrial n=1 Tax=Daktulosphaira vitifoliae TaxID=58002 RepID=UPI0021A9850C|nr:39S ribosomal protein L3, mitochondrial [Daktulosphaira vitifoliae]
MNDIVKHTLFNFPKSFKFKLNDLKFIQYRYAHNVRPPRIKYPMWYLQRERAKDEQHLTSDNRAFIKEVVHDKFGMPAVIHGISTYDLKSPLAENSVEHNVKWNPKFTRSGLIARKIGNYPLWLNNGKSVLTTLLQVIDNHVIKYIPPGEFDPPRKPYSCPNHKKQLGCLLVGAESADPQYFTKEYCGIFYKEGMMPKKYLGRFLISPEAALQPGTPLLASHFRVGDTIDIRGKTIDRGFQGVMKRWGFHGMPATHGVTKSHRRGGNIGHGGEKGRVFPGTKMPGHMGNRYRIHRGATILRINHKFNVIWVKGVASPGETNSIVYLYDTLLPLRKPKTALPFPTSKRSEDNEIDSYADEVYKFTDQTITFEEEK